MTILDIGGGFNGTETQLELVSLGVLFYSLIRLIELMFIFSHFYNIVFGRSIMQS